MNTKDILFTAGYAVLDGTQYIGMLDINSIEFVWEDKYGLEENTPASHKEQTHQILYAIHTTIAEQIVEPMVAEYEMMHSNIWEGIVRNTDKWHTDCEEPFNLFFLLYFNKTSIWFRNSEGELEVDTEPGTLVAINQSDKTWLHRAVPSDSKRVTACFRFKVKW
jgi:hypothetical protein